MESTLSSRTSAPFCTSFQNTTHPQRNSLGRLIALGLTLFAGLASQSFCVAIPESNALALQTKLATREHCQQDMELSICGYKDNTTGIPSALAADNNLQETLANNLDIRRTGAPIICVDLHETYLKKRRFNAIKKVAGIIATNPRTIKLIGSMGTIRTAITEGEKAGKTGEEVLEELARKSKTIAKIKKQLLKATSTGAYRPSNKMYKILAKLKNKGYKIYAVSNIGPISYGYLKKKYARQFNIFEDNFIPAKAGSTNKTKPEFYNKLRVHLDARGDQGPIIFIDDRKDYLAAAHKTHSESAPLYGLRFTSATRLERQLNSMLQSLPQPNTNV